MIQFWSRSVKEKVNLQQRYEQEKGRKGYWWLWTVVQVLINQIIIEYKQCIKNYCPKSSLILIFKLRFQYNFNFRLLKKKKKKLNNDFRLFYFNFLDWARRVAFKIKIQSYSISTRNFINPKVLTQTLWFIKHGYY